MPSWKKVVVSGSNANLASLEVDTLASGQVVLGGGSGSVLTTVAVNGTGNQVATTGATGVSISGSFSGSFQGTINATIASASVANQVAFPLNGGSMIQSFVYSGSVAETVNVVTSSLVLNQIPKIVGNAFSGSNISDTGTQVVIGGSAGLSVTNDTVIGGNLTVNGTTTLINTSNVFIKDKFIMLNSGSSALGDSGIIVAYTTGSGGVAGSASGSAFYLDSGNTGTFGRFAVAFDVNETSTSVTPDSYVVTSTTASAVPTTAPTWGGSGTGYGNIQINSSTDDIYIWA